MNGTWIFFQAIFFLVKLNMTFSSPFSQISFYTHQKTFLKFPNTTNVTQTSKEVASKMNCVEDCVATPWCVSINFKTTPQQNGLHLCEFLSSDVFRNEIYLQKSADYIHYSIKNPCKLNASLCASGGLCTFHNNRQDYRCVCTSGYRGDRCQEDINECDQPESCHKDAACVNKPGSYSCQCKQGYQGDGKTNCTDIDECMTNNICGQSGRCQNTLGSYKCVCNVGHWYNGTSCIKYSWRGLGNSTIMTLYGNTSYFEALSGYLASVLKHNNSYWVRCWSGLSDGFEAATFHTNCDNKGPTVTIVNVKNLYIFGGYTDISWRRTGGYQNSAVSFLFSLYNKHGYKPEKLSVLKPDQAVHLASVNGPTFGSGNDQHVAGRGNVIGLSHANYGSYEMASGCTSGNCAFMADTFKFLINDVEVFYEVDGSSL